MISVRGLVFEDSLGCGLDFWDGERRGSRSVATAPRLTLLLFNVWGCFSTRPHGRSDERSNWSQQMRKGRNRHGMSARADQASQSFPEAAHSSIIPHPRPGLECVMHYSQSPKVQRPHRARHLSSTPTLSSKSFQQPVEQQVPANVRHLV